MCQAQSSGCTDWEAQPACTTGLVCKSGACSACSTHGECDATQACTYLNSTNGRCVSDTNRQWDIYIWRVVFPQFDATGVLWDPGGYPDPLIEVKVNGVVAGTVRADDTNSIDRTGTTFSPIRVTLPSHATPIDVLAFDEDLTTNDSADGSRWADGINLAKNQGYDGLLYSQRVEISFSIRPVP